MCRKRSVGKAMINLANSIKLADQDDESLESSFSMLQLTQNRLSSRPSSCLHQEVLERHLRLVPPNNNIDSVLPVVMVPSMCSLFQSSLDIAKLLRKWAQPTDLLRGYRGARHCRCASQCSQAPGFVAEAFCILLQCTCHVTESSRFLFGHSKTRSAINFVVDSEVLTLASSSNFMGGSAQASIAGSPTPLQRQLLQPGATPAKRMRRCCLHLFATQSLSKSVVSDRAVVFVGSPKTAWGCLRPLLVST